MSFEFVPVIENIGYIKIPDSCPFSCVYLIGSRDNAIIIDTHVASFADELISSLENAGFRPQGVRAILITHGHEDHYGGAAALKNWCGAPVWAHLHTAVQMEDPWGYFTAMNSWMLNHTKEHWDAFCKRAGSALQVDRILREGDTIDHAGMRFSVLVAPGHDRGELVLHEPHRRLVFTGDLVQGGMDSARNWLGFFTDVTSQRKSLNRIAALKPEWNFKFHRAPRFGLDVETDIACAIGRLDAVELALLEALAEKSPLTLAEAARSVFLKVLNNTVAELPNYACVGAYAFLLELSRQGKVRRTADFTWELCGTASTVDTPSNER